MGSPKLRPVVDWGLWDAGWRPHQRGARTASWPNGSLCLLPADWSYQRLPPPTLHQCLPFHLCSASSVHLLQRQDHALSCPQAQGNSWTSTGAWAALLCRLPTCLCPERRSASDCHRCTAAWVRLHLSSWQPGVSCNGPTNPSANGSLPFPNSHFSGWLRGLPHLLEHAPW